MWILGHSLMSVILLQFKCVTHFKAGISRKMHWFLFLPPPLCVEFTAHKTTQWSVRVSVTQDDSFHVYICVFVSLKACRAHIASCDLAQIHIKSLVDNVWWWSPRLCLFANWMESKERQLHGESAWDRFGPWGLWSNSGIRMWSVTKTPLSCACLKTHHSHRICFKWTF